MRVWGLRKWHCALVSPNDTNTSETNTTEEPKENNATTPVEEPKPPVLLNKPLALGFDTTELTVTKGGEYTFDVNATGDDVQITATLINLDNNTSQEVVVTDGKISAFFAPLDGQTQHFQLRVNATDTNPDTGVDETNTTVKNITVLDPICEQVKVEYAPIPTDPQRGDIFTPTAPTFAREGNTTFLVNGTEVFANEPVEFIAKDVNYTVQTQILPTLEGCGIQSETNTSLLKISTPLSVEASFYPVSTLYGAVNSFDTYAITQADLNASVQTFIAGDNVSTKIFLQDENGTVADLNNLQAGKIYTIKVTATEQNGTTTNTSQALTVNAGEIYEELPEIATPSISSTSGSSTTYTHKVSVKEELSLVVDGKILESVNGSVTFSVSAGPHTAEFVNNAKRKGNPDTFSHTYVNPDKDEDGVPNTKDQCPNTTAEKPVDANGCEIIADTPTSFNVSYTTENDPVLGDLVIPTGNIFSTDQKIEYIVVNGEQIDVNAMNFTFSGARAFDGTSIAIQVKLEAKNELENFSS